MSGTISQDSENKLDKQASSLPLKDKGISGTAELSALTAETKWEGLGRGRCLWDDIPGWMRGKNGANKQIVFLKLMKSAVPDLLEAGWGWATR